MGTIRHLDGSVQGPPASSTTAPCTCSASPETKIVGRLSAGDIAQNQGGECKTLSGLSTSCTSFEPLDAGRLELRTPGAPSHGIQRSDIPKSKIKTPRRVLDFQQSRSPQVQDLGANRLPSAYLVPPMNTSSVAQTAIKRPVRFLVASVGNPAPYQNTRHSAGHILLKSIRSHLSLPKFERSKAYGGQLSHGHLVGKPEWTLFQSASLMNTSGLSVLKAYREFVKEHNAISQDSPIDGLVVLHDEMELAPATVRLRRGPTSAKGHNGIRSVQQSLLSAGLLDGLSKGVPATGSSTPGQPPDRYIKLAIGIGRPEGKTRDTNDISAYVLGQLTTKEKEGLDDLAGQVVAMLEAEMARLP